MRVQHSKGILEELEMDNIGEILQITTLFNRMVDDEDNEILFRVVTKGELLHILNSFKKDRIPCLDGWAIEF